MNSFRPPGIFRFIAGLLVLWLGWISLPHAHAGRIKTVPLPPVDDRILVSSVDLPHHQVTIIYEKNKQTHVYSIDEATRITVQGKPGDLPGIKAGQQVYNYLERDDKTLNSIDVADAQSPPVAPSQK